LAAGHLGVATHADLADYHRQRVPASRSALRRLVEEGRLVEVAVEGWSAPGYVRPDARVPRRVAASTLLSPFDSMVWKRDRVERLFDFHYRIEIYTPRHRRTYGYYVMPFLLGDRLVARVDLKADRQARVLRVHGAFAEPHAYDHPGEAQVAAEVATQLSLMSSWLELDRVDVELHGDLASGLARAVAGSRR
jgi:uncharacterized protein YcaQ